MVCNGECLFLPVFTAKTTGSYIWYIAFRLGTAELFVGLLSMVLITVADNLIKGIFYMIQIGDVNFKSNEAFH